jgi:hypothetical protein
MQQITRNGIVDSVIVLLTENRFKGNDAYLVFSETDPQFTAELEKGSLIMRLNGKKLQYTDSNIDRMLPILSAPIFDYK